MNAARVQQQTLSVRITESLRARLERARQLASRAGEAVSISEIAKQFLESAREDRLEVVDLLADPLTTLLQVRRKGEAGHQLSRAEWTVVAYFVQQGLEAYSVETPNAIANSSWVTVIDAFLALYALRGERAVPEDAFYLGNLPVQVRPAPMQGTKRAEQVTADIVRRATVETRKRVDQAPTEVLPAFVGRNLYHLVENTSAGHELVDRALRPFWSVLWRLAARGYYAVTHQPVREPASRHDGSYQPPFPPITENGYTLSFVGGEGSEISALLSFPAPRGPLYPLTSYPRLAEFRAMLDTMGRGDDRLWNGVHFFGYATPRPPQAATEIWFRAHDNGITLGLTVAEWATVRTLFERAWELPDLQLAWDRLTLEYGEL
jgi:hypothetical protein